MSDDDDWSGSDKQILNPEWGKAGKVHDWRNHVPEVIRNNWLAFSEDQRRLLFQWADDLAGQEQWE